jgi:hypothetical protein
MNLWFEEKSSFTTFFVQVVFFVSAFIPGSTKGVYYFLFFFFNNSNNCRRTSNRKDVIGKGEESEFDSKDWCDWWGHQWFGICSITQKETQPTESN